MAALDVSNDPHNAITRLCMLQAEVAHLLGFKEPNDCFCGTGGFWAERDWPRDVPPDWRSAGTAIAFIENTVRAEIDRVKAIRDAACFADVEVHD